MANPRTVRLLNAVRSTHAEIVSRLPLGVKSEDQNQYDRIYDINWLIKKRSQTKLTEKDLQTECIKYLRKYAPEKL